MREFSNKIMSMQIERYCSTSSTGIRMKTEENTNHNNWVMDLFNLIEIANYIVHICD